MYPKRMKILKIGQIPQRTRFACVRRRKSGELWSTNYGDLKVESYPPKSTFSGDHISAPKECCALKFLYVLENDQVLLAHTPPGMGVSLTIFSMGFKIGFEIDLSVSVTFGGRVSESTKLCHMTCHKVGIITYVKKIWAPAPQKFGRAKLQKFDAILDDFRL